MRQNLYFCDSVESEFQKTTFPESTSPKSALIKIKDCLNEWRSVLDDKKTSLTSLKDGINYLKKILDELKNEKELDRKGQFELSASTTYMLFLLKCSIKFAEEYRTISSKRHNEELFKRLEVIEVKIKEYPLYFLEEVGSFYNNLANIACDAASTISKEKEDWLKRASSWYLKSFALLKKVYGDTPTITISIALKNISLISLLQKDYERAAKPLFLSIEMLKEICKAYEGIEFNYAREIYGSAKKQLEEIANMLKTSVSKEDFQSLIEKAEIVNKSDFVDVLKKLGNAINDGKDEIKR